MAEISLKSEKINEQEVGMEFLENMDKTVDTVVVQNAWAQLQAAQASETELEQVVQNEGLEHDEQTRLFTRFLSLATNFSSANFTDRLSSVPKVVQSIADLLDAMRREVEEYADIANQFEELVQIFVKLVIDTQHKMSLILPHMSAAKDHLGVLLEIFESNNNALTNIDHSDIKIAMNGLLKGMKQMVDVSHHSGNESRELAERITKLKTNVHKRRGTAHGRIHLSKALSCLGPLAGAAIVARAVSALVAIKELGGSGLLVVAGASLNPIAAIICGALLGGSLIITIAGLVYRFWTRHQYKALAFLEQISTGLMNLANANMFLLNYLNKSEEAANTIATQLEQIECSLTSERYRKQNAILCKRTVAVVKQAVEIMEDIRNIDIKPWLTPQSVSYLTINKLMVAVEMPPTE